MARQRPDEAAVPAGQSPGLQCHQVRISISVQVGEQDRGHKAQIAVASLPNQTEISVQHVHCDSALVRRVCEQYRCDDVHSRTENGGRQCLRGYSWRIRRNPRARHTCSGQYVRHTRRKLPLCVWRRPDDMVRRRIGDFIACVRPVVLPEYGKVRRSAGSHGHGSCMQEVDGRAAGLSVCGV